LWHHVDCAAVFLLAPALHSVFFHLSHSTVSAAMRHAVAREEAVGYFRRMLDADGSAVRELDTADATRAWKYGPLIEIYKWGVLVGLVVHACDVATACWAHGCYAVDEPSILCVRYVSGMLTLVPIWRLLITHPRLITIETSHELCGIVATAHTLYAMGHLAVALGLAQLLLDGAPADKCEETLTGQPPTSLEGPLGLFEAQQLHSVIRVCRNLILSFLAAAQHSSELHRALNVALTVACVMLSEPGSASWADGLVVTSIFGALLPCLGLHGAIGASWQRDHLVALLEMRRRAQLQTKTVNYLRLSIDRCNAAPVWPPSADADQQQDVPDDTQAGPSTGTEQNGWLTASASANVLVRAAVLPPPKPLTPSTPLPCSKHWSPPCPGPSLPLRSGSSTRDLTRTTHLITRRACLRLNKYDIYLPICRYIDRQIEWI
jgi:hypothetical protein